MDFEIFPNPVDDELTIKLKNKGFEYVKILDQQGREILKMPIDSANLNINTSILENGIYFVKIDETVQRFIKK
ncbi:MAG: T9SS type A sorting domain-containing protein [Flavobacteriales bacterium]|nr:T9SS type A sorting domain-containing protein [Flavobacteriales bacterium]